MSTAPSDVVRSYFSTFESGGVDAAARYWHPDIEWRAIENAADDVGVIRGQDALRHYYEDWIDTLADLRAEIEEVLFEDDDRVAVAVRNSGRGRASGAAAEGRYYIACVVRAGRIVTGREYATREGALEGVRLLTRA
jgi:ketosteroid isomerase-like protein